MKPSAARLAALAAAVLFSTGGAAIKVQAFSAAQVSARRSGVAVVALVVWLGRRAVPDWRAAAVGVVYAATLTLFVLATKLTTAANAIFLEDTAPLYLLALGPWLLGERFRRRDLWYMAAMAAGLAMCFAGQPVPSSTAPDPALGNLFALACSVAWAATLLALRWLEREPGRAGSGLTAVVAGNAIACLAALPFAIPLPHATVVEWGTVLYLGVFQIGLAYVALTLAMRALPALDVSLLLLLEPVLNPLWTWIVRGEAPGSWVLAGGAVIVGATAVNELVARRASRAGA